jgi:hypothetical protein
MRKPMKLQLQQWKEKNQSPKKEHKKKQPKKGKQEKLSERELKDLMGMNKRTYSRGKGGAFRQK